MRKGVVAILSTFLGGSLGLALTGMKAAKDIEEKQKLSDKHLKMFKMMDCWVGIKQEGKNLADYFKKNGYEKIAIYGMHYAGERLVEELRDTDIQVVCGIDRNAQSVYSEMDVITKEDVIPEVDAIVVTAITFFDEIECDLLQKVTCDIISLEDVIYGM